MILSDIKKYLQEHKQVPLEDLVNHFDTPPDAMRGMLEQWIRKGKVLKVMEKTSHCGSCNCCHCAPVELYKWAS